MIEFLADNWLWMAAVALVVVMHRSGHGCGMHRAHIGHTGHAGHQRGDDERRPTEPIDTDRNAA